MTDAVEGAVLEENIIETVSEDIAEETPIKTKKTRKRRKLNKPAKIFIITFLEIILLGVGVFGGYMIAKLTIPVFVPLGDYMTYNELVTYYEYNADDKKVNVEAYGKDYFALYSRCYLNVLKTKRINVITDSKTLSAGVTVNVKNTKKLEDGKMFMHIVSKGSAMQNMTDNHYKTYLEIDYEKNDQTMVKVDNILKQEYKEQSEAGYMNKWGVLPYAFAGHLITPETIKGGGLEKDEGSGLYTLTFELEPELSTRNLIVQMGVLANGKSTSYSGGKITYSVTFDGEFKIYSVHIVEKYRVIGMSCDAESTDTYYYESDEGYLSLEDNEKYENIQNPY